MTLYIIWLRNFCHMLPPRLLREAVLSWQKGSKKAHDTATAGLHTSARMIKSCNHLLACWANAALQTKTHVCVRHTDAWLPAFLQASPAAGGAPTDVSRLRPGTRCCRCLRCWLYVAIAVLLSLPPCPKVPAALW